MSLRALTLIAVAFTLTLAGCPQTAPESASELSTTLDADGAAPTDVADEEAALRRQQAASAWLEDDSDNDGLPTDIELEFGLDPDDPTDGMDIDGDGVPNFRDDDVDGDSITNETDPDIDGDGVFNLIDIDIDGDAVTDDVDFDMDADGIRNEWDWDDDSDGDDDGPDDNDDDFGSLGDEDLRFSAAVQALTEKLAAAGEVSNPELRDKAEKQYREDLRDLLAQVSKVKHERRPIPLDGKEMQLIAKSLACRFKRGGSKTLEYDLKTTISQLTPRHGAPQPGDDPGTFRDPDATDAIEAVFRLATEVKDPGRKEATEEVQQKLDALVSLKSRLRQKEVTPVDCYDAVTKLVSMPGEGSPQDKVTGLTRLWDVVEEPNLDGLLSDLDTMSQALSTRLDNWTWETMIDAVTQLEEMSGTGTLQEKFDGLMRVWDVVGEPELDELMTGLSDLTQALDNHITGDWGWDVMIEALEGAPGIENGIGWEQINHTVEEVSEIEGE